MSASHTGPSSASSGTSPSHSQWLSAQEICRSPASNSLFCVVAVFTGGCFGDVFISLECDHPLPLFFTQDTYKYTVPYRWSPLKPAPICIIFIYIYIKAQLQAKVINADHSYSHLTEAMCTGPEHTTPPLENSQGASSQTGKLNCQPTLLSH